jgi:hypothetical protein
MDDKAAEGSQRVEVQVLLAEEHQASLPAVIARLQEAGMEVAEKLEEVGAVTGHVRSTQVEALRGIDGVSDVERSRAVGVAPPDSPVQ